MMTAGPGLTLGRPIPPAAGTPSADTSPPISSTSARWTTPIICSPGSRLPRTSCPRARVCTWAQNSSTIAALTSASSSARVVRMVNSAAYGVTTKVSNLHSAISFLGFTQVRNLALTASVSDIFKNDERIGTYGRRDLWRQLQQLRSSRGQTVALTTHLMDEADRCDRLAVMAQGKIIAIDTPANLKARIGGDVVMLTPKAGGDNAESLRAQIEARFGPWAQGAAPRIVSDRIHMEKSNGAAFIAALGQRTNASHNEVVLMAGSLGVSSLVCLLNNGNMGQTETTYNLLGPFWRMNSPKTESGGTIIRSPTPGPAIFVDCRFKDQKGNPIGGALVDIWHSSPEGFYEQQDPKQADMNLRGQFDTDANGHFSFRSVKPSGYPVPIDGPVGDLIRAQGRHNMRPAHLHFLAFKEGYKTLVTQIYVPDDPVVESDVQFGVTRALLGNYVRHDSGEKAPAPDVEGEWYSLDHTFVMEPGVAKLPRPPIQ